MQEQKQEWVRDLTVTVVDLDYNVLSPGSLDNYVGNAFTGLPVDLPPAGGALLDVGVRV